MNCSTVLVISDDAEFSRSIQQRWCSESFPPSLVAIAPDICAGIDSGNFNLAIVDGRGVNFRENVFVNLIATGKAVILVHATSLERLAACTFRSQIIAIPSHENWPDLLVQFGSRLLSYSEMIDRASALERQNAALQLQAALGRYTAEMRHSLNNALTSVLGNAELLLLNPESLGPGVCLQVDTIRTMALRIHEFLQRFTSIEKEMTVGETTSNCHSFQAAGISASQ